MYRRSEELPSCPAVKALPEHVMECICDLYVAHSLGRGLAAMTISRYRDGTGRGCRAKMSAVQPSVWEEEEEEYSSWCYWLLLSAFCRRPECVECVEVEVHCPFFTVG